MSFPEKFKSLEPFTISRAIPYKGRGRHLVFCAVLGSQAVIHMDLRYQKAKASADKCYEATQHIGMQPNAYKQATRPPTPDNLEVIIKAVGARLCMYTYIKV